MTEEERIEYEERKLQLEEEMRKKKEELLVQFLKTKMARDEVFTKTNMFIINDRWRQIMRDAKSKELKAEIIIRKNTFDHQIDQKDEVIKALVLDIKEAEEQYMMAHRSHLQILDQLWDFQKERLATLQIESDKELDLIKQSFELDRKVILDIHDADMNELADIFFAVEEIFVEKKNEAKANFQVQEHEVLSKSLEEKDQLHVSLETKINNLWQLFNQVKSHYHETTKERMEAFEKLKLKDSESSKVIDILMRKIQRRTEQITAMKGKIVINARTNGEKNKMMREEKEKMTVVIQGMKIEVNKLQTAEYNKLVNLTLESRAAIKELEEQNEKCIQILRLFEGCRKLETEEEKILPFHASSFTKEEKEELLRHDMESPTEPLAKLMMEYQPLENFWKRYQKVMLDKVVLQKEQNLLTQENQKLRCLLKQYLDGISVNNAVLSEVNPLLMIRGSENAGLQIEMNDPRVMKKNPTGHVKQEAALIAKNIIY